MEATTESRVGGTAMLGIAPEPLLQVRGLKCHYPVTEGLLVTRTVATVKAVDGVDFDVLAKRSYSLIGESGSGKTTTARMVLLLERPTAGSIVFNGKDVLKLKGAALKEFRSGVQAVFQDPYSCLNPRMRVGRIVAEPLIENSKLSSSEVNDRVREGLARVGLPKNAATLYPHEFSGGQRQRIAIARALILNPKLVVLDEPVSALDVSIRGQIMNLLQDLQGKSDLAYFLIAHHLSTIRRLSHVTGVMYLGRLVEMCPTEDLFKQPLHPYSQALLSAALPAHPDKATNEILLSGEIPSPMNIPSGCRFHTRCFKLPKLSDVQKSHCVHEEPLFSVTDRDRKVACHYLE